MHGAAYNEVVARFARTLQAGGLDEPARQKLQALGDRLTAVHVALANEAPGADCKAIGQTLSGLSAELK